VRYQLARRCGDRVRDRGRAVDLSAGDMAYDNVALSIGAYEGSSEVNAFSSKHDYSFEGMTKLGKEERRGYALFRGKGQCHRRHTSSGQEALFTDFTSDNLGVPPDPENPAGVAPAFVDPVVTPCSSDLKPPFGARPPIP
jgi:cytochrome c peroxidase